MKEYTYYFNNGKKSTVLIEDKWYYILKEMDDAERRQRYNYNRHNIPLSVFGYESEAFEDRAADPYLKLLESEQKAKINEAVSSLTDCQRELFEQFFLDKRKVTDIANTQGVSQQAVSDRIKRIRTKLQKYLA